MGSRRVGAAARRALATDSKLPTIEFLGSAMLSSEGQRIATGCAAHTSEYAAGAI